MLKMDKNRHAWNKVTSPERNLVVLEIAQIARGSKVHHVCVLRWPGTVGNSESVKRRKLSWKDVWHRDTSQNRFLLSGTYDILSSSVNQNQWLHNVCYSQIQTYHH